MLRSLRVRNFRLLRDFELKLPALEHPLVLVGPNASGKSTILEVIDFLSRCAEHGLEQAVQAHGGISSIQTAGSMGPIEIETRWAFTHQPGTEPNNYHLTWAISIEARPNGAARVISEALTHDDKPVLSTRDGVRHVHPIDGPQYPVESSPTKLVWESLSDDRRFPALYLLRLLLESSRVLGALPVSPSWVLADQASRSLREAMVLGPNNVLSRQGFGLATMLYHIFTEHHERWALLEKSFRGEFPFVKRLIFPPDAGGGRISFAFEDTRFPERKLYASEMSDGMVAYLCLLAAALNAEQIGVLALDEPDVHLHPSALRRFMKLLHSPLSERRTIVLTTHSNALLDELENAAQSIRIIEAAAGGTKARALDEAALATWRQEYSLAELRRTGLLDQANSDYGKDT